MAFDYTNYYECAFLQPSAQGAYIDTGLSSANNYEIEINFSWIAGTYIFGSTTGLYWGLEGTTYRTPTGLKQSLPFTAGGTYTVICTKSSLSINGTSYTLGSDTNSGSGNITLFRYNANNAVINLRINYFKAKLNNTLVSDLRPAIRKSDGVYGFYDTINNTFLTNAGSNSFLVGPILNQSASDYNKLNYLEANGTQWLITSHQPTLNTKVETGIYLPGAYGGVVIGNSSTSDNDDYRFFNASNRAYLDIGSNRTYGGTIASNTYYDIEFTNNYVKANGTTQTSGSTITTNTIGTQTINVFRKTTDANYASGKIYYLKIYESNVLVKDFVPAENKLTGAIGLYDVLNNTFCINNGSGTFIKGDYDSTTYLLNVESPGGYITGDGTILKSPDGKAYFTVEETPYPKFTFDGWYSDSTYETLLSSNNTYSGYIEESTTIYAKYLFDGSSTCFFLRKFI